MNSRCFVLTVIVVFALTCSVLAVVEDLSAAWGAYGYKRCLSRSKGKPNAPLAACTTFQELLEETMEQQAATLSMATSVPASDMLRRSFEDHFYRSYGNDIVDDVLDWMLAKRIRDEERIRRRFTNQLGSWLLKVAAKDTNMQNVGRADPKVAEMF